MNLNKRSNKKYPYLRKISRLRFAGGLVNSCFKPGHFYSPIVSLKHIIKREEQLLNECKSPSLTGINLNGEQQTDLLKKLAHYYYEKDLLFEKGNKRFYLDNHIFLHTDAVFLSLMIKHYKPKRIIEVGSGFSSALMLDTIESMEHKAEITLIEPFPSRLHSLLKRDDLSKIYLKESEVQDIDKEYFRSLKENDILFIDSSHISKTGSDVNYILFQILPILNKGVIIHFHDIFYPFEYPYSWILEGRSWNEIYLLKAFLMYNDDFEIILFSDYLHKFYESCFETMPICYKNTGGSIWLQKNNNS